MIEGNSLHGGDGMQDDRLRDSDARSLTDAEWFQRLEAIGEESGYFAPLGSMHSAMFLDDASTLLVTFDTVKGIRQSQGAQLPLGHLIAKSRRWSHLGLIAHHDTWFRDRSVYGFFDRLIEDAFFEDFDQVVFYGAGMCGYAAAAFSVAAPGATVILIHPRIAGWDPRFTEMRRTDFTDRYGFAPDMTEGAGPVYVIFDPEQSLDAMHAALFARSYTTLLPCPHLGRDIAGALDGMRILPSILTAAGTGAFDARLFRTFYRSRRNYLPYLKSLMSRLDRDGRPYLNAFLCNNVAQRLNAPDFARRLAEIEAELIRAGIPFPPLATVGA
jgi:hypothetical protein